MNGISLECARKEEKMRGRAQAFELTIWHSSEQLHKHKHYRPDGGGCWAGAGGPADYKTNLRTDRGHLCPQRTPGITDPRCANEGRTARHMPQGCPTPFSLMSGSYRSPWKWFWFLYVCCRARSLPCRVKEKRMQSVTYWYTCGSVLQWSSLQC